MFQVGVTGSRAGITDAQDRRALELLDDLKPTWLHHGDCVGADEALHRIAQHLGISIGIHPPKAETYRAWLIGNSAWPARPYLKRDQEIVDYSEILIAFPRSRETKSSGTWATFRMAREAGKPRIAVLPDGCCIREE
jgi:hypothetical protein